MLAELVEKIEQKNLTKGKIEGKFETAEAMFREGISMEMISRCTGLTEEELKSVK